MRQLAVEQGVLSSIAVDETSVYWVDSRRGFVMSVPKSGGALRTIAPVSSVTGYLTHITVDSSCVYWTDNTPEGPVVMRAPKE